jgi:methyl-accepting chemotaxis protein
MRAAEAARNTSDLISGTVKSVQEGSTLVSQTTRRLSRWATPC